MININKVKTNLKETGYIASDELAKAVALFEAAGKRDSKSIPAMLLEGPAGAGKTFLAEAFSNIVGAKKLFLQCYKGIGSDNLIIEPNIAAIIRKDGDHTINDGILVKALKRSNEGPVVIILDEVDKADASFDAMLLDFLNSGRITDGINEWKKGSFPIWAFLTSNKERDLSDALLNRCRRQLLDRMPKEVFLKALGLDQNDVYNIGLIYEKFPTFSLRQARSYIEDLEVLEETFDRETLEQYVDFNNVEINTLEELQMFQNTNKNIKHLDLDVTEDLKNWILENPEEINLVEDRETIKARICSLETLAKVIDELPVEGYSSYEEYDLLTADKFITKKVLCKNIGVFYIAPLKKSFIGRIIDGQVYIKVPGHLLDKWLGNDYDDDDYDDDDYDDDDYNNYDD